MKVKKTKKMIALILIVIMAISSLSVISKVFADGEPEIISIGEEKYTAFLDALRARKSGDTLVLLDDVTDNRYFGIGGGKDLTIELNGHDLYIGGFQINNSNVIITGEGTVYVSNQQPFVLIGSTENIENYSTLTVDKDVTLHSTNTSSYYMIVHNWLSPFNDRYGVKVNFNGKIEGEEGSDGVGLYVSGNYTSTEDVFTIGNYLYINGDKLIIKTYRKHKKSNRRKGRYDFLCRLRTACGRSCPHRGRSPRCPA